MRAESRAIPARFRMNRNLWRHDVFQGGQELPFVGRGQPWRLGDAIGTLKYNCGIELWVHGHCVQDVRATLGAFYEQDDTAAV